MILLLTLKGKCLLGRDIIFRLMGSVDVALVSLLLTLYVIIRTFLVFFPSIFLSNFEHAFLSWDSSTLVAN